MSKFKNLKNIIFNWFCKTWLGGLYFNFLLWLDTLSFNDNANDTLFGNKYSSNKELKRAILDLQQIAYREGIGNIKNKINELVQSKTSSEYHRVLTSIEDLMELAKSDNKDKERLLEIMRRAVIISDRDIKTHTDRAKMVQKRIQDYEELHRHIESRQLRRKIRKAENSGDKQLALTLTEEWKKKYGRNGNSSRNR